MARATIRIGLLWHSARSGNLGVGALTVANLSLAREAAEAMGLEPSFTILGMRDAASPPVVGDEVAVVAIDWRRLLSPGGFWRDASAVDCVIDIGAGDSFAEIYGPKRFAMLWLTKIAAIARRVPLLLAPQTIGPFTRPVYRRLAAIAMNRAAAVVARDRASFALVQELAPKARAALAADVAFVLPFADRSAERGGATGGRLRVGVNASGLLFAEAESGRNRFGLEMDYAVFTRRLLAALCARDDVEVHLIAHATSPIDPNDDDGALADRLAAEFPAALRVPDFAGPSAAKAHLSSLDFLVAARMHACIGAFSAGTPVAPVAYSRKFEGAFGLLGYDAIVPVRGMDADAALAYVLAALDRREALAADEARGMAQVQTLLDAYRAELRRAFALAMERTGKDRA